MNDNIIKLKQLPWTEKYRPDKIKDLILTKDLRKKFNKIIDEKISPNIILTGATGIGKTTAVKCLANELYQNYDNQLIMEFNASDDRGVKTIYNDIVSFCKRKVVINKKDINNISKKKMVIIDEADNIVGRVQPQINSIIEEFQDKVTFVFTCLSSTSIIESIQSRCKIINYMWIYDDKTFQEINQEIYEKIEKILDKEKVNFNVNILKQIIKENKVDIRSIINIIQLINICYGEITHEQYIKLFDKPYQYVITKLIEQLLINNLYEIIIILNKLKTDGYSGYDTIFGILSIIKTLTLNNMTEEQRMIIFMNSSIASYKISNGVDSYLQVLSCMCEIIKILHP